MSSMMEKKKKAGRYNRVCDQLTEFLHPHNNEIAAMATIAAVLHHKFDYFFWTGFYLLTDGELIVGPYQGPVACIKLTKGTGVCWAGVNRKETVIVPDVHKFPGHIACNDRSNSEIVIPVYGKNGKVLAVLDVDSKELNSFDEEDAKGLERIVDLIYRKVIK
jgi:L-methionine (R)-S-oxide reductase